MQHLGVRSGHIQPHRTGAMKPLAWPCTCASGCFRGSIPWAKQQPSALQEQHQCVVLCGVREAPAYATLTSCTLATTSFPFQEHGQAGWICPGSAASRYLQPSVLLILEALHRETANGFGLLTSDKQRLPHLLLELRYLLWYLISN